MKNKLKQSKIDLFVELLVVSTVIPLITNSFISLSDTVETILNYVILLFIYWGIKKLNINNEKTISKFKNLFMIFTIIVIAIGIEGLTTNKILPLIGFKNIANGEGRLVSIITNPNVLATFITFAFFISTNELVYAKEDKYKSLYSTINTIYITGIILTYSKLTFIVISFMLLIYIITLNDKSKRICIITNIIQSIVMSVIFVYVFQKFLTYKYYLSIVLFIILWIRIITLWNKLNFIIEEKFKKYKLRTFIIGILIVSIIGISWVCLQLQNTKEFVVFPEDTTSDYNAKIINNIKPNTKYVFKFDMYAKSNRDNMFTLKIIERDSKSLEEIDSEKFTFGNYSGIKEFEITTSSKTTEIKLEFRAKYIDEPKQLLINQLLLNDKKVALEYKYLPTKLIEKIRSINLQYKTAQERFVFIKDGFKLISKNFLTGIGGNGWEYNYSQIQDYGYITSNVHSYILQVWLEFGILGFISLLYIIWFIFKQKYKSEDIEIKFKGLKFALLALLLHSAFDVDMNYFYMLIIFFISLGFITSMNEKYKIEKKSSLKDKAPYIITIVLVILLKVGLNQQVNSIDNLQTKIEESKIDLEKYKEYNKKLAKKYELKEKFERYDIAYLDAEEKKIIAYINCDDEKLDERLQQYYEKMVDYKNASKHDEIKIALKNNCITRVLTVLKEKNYSKLFPWITKLSQLNIDEYEATATELIKCLNEKHKNIIREIEYMQLENNFMYNKDIYEEYSLGVRIFNNTRLNIKDYVQDENVQLYNNENILIYHTYTTESYNSNKYEKLEDGRTIDENYNVLSVGNELAQNLKNKGYNAIQLRNYNDLNGTDESSINSRNTIINYLQNINSNVNIIFDIQRDLNKTSDKSNTIEIDNKKVAKLRLDIAVGNENWVDNIKWAIKVQKKADELYPGLFEPMMIHTGKYNQDLGKYATTLQVGNAKNTVEEAKGSMECLANIINSIL